jgi:hypothetical protein
MVHNLTIFAAFFVYHFPQNPKNAPLQFRNRGAFWETKSIYEICYLNLLENVNFFGNYVVKKYIHHFAKIAHVENKGEMSKMSDFPQAIVTPSIEPRNGE